MKRTGILATIGATAFLLAALGLVHGQQVHRNSFEARETAWQRGTTDAAFRETTHDMTDATAHTGQLSEHIALTAERGSQIYYFYPTGRAPVTDELSVSVWVKANRPGAQVAARIVLPKERSATNLDEPLTTLIRGDLYQLVSRWQRLEIRRPVKLMKEQQQFMRAELGRDVDFTDAYVDRLVLNVYSGPGQTEVWIDDLEIGPVLEANPFRPVSRPVQLKSPDVPNAPAPTAVPGKGAVVEVNQDNLLVNSRRFFLRGIRHTDAPMKVLREAGFNTVWLDGNAPPVLIDEALASGFFVVPSLRTGGDDANRLAQDVARFVEKDGILFWDLGGGLSEEQAQATVRAAQVVRSADPQRPLGADVWDGFRAYARHLELLGVHRWPLQTGMELTQYRDWLNQRRLLRQAGPSTYTWTWVQTHLPDWYTNLVYNQSAAAPFSEPIGPQPEQIRLLTYIALAAGCRGVGFWSDRFLADSHQGRDRLLTIALLNQELKMLEPLLVTAQTPVWIDTSLPEVKAAVLRTDRGVLVLPMWLGKGAQFVPGQEATATLSLVVPQVPVGSWPWEVTPGEVRCLRYERVVGGVRVTVPEFSLTSAIVFTSDNAPNGLVARLQDQVKEGRQAAAQWSCTLAEVELEKVAKVQAELERLGHTTPDAQALLDDARRRLQTAKNLQSGDHRQAYLEAQRVLRPVRILMRSQWEAAVKELDGLAVASPFAVSFFTLPKHWQFLAQIRQGKAGENVLPEGGFEGNASQPASSWSAQEATLDAVELVARRVTDTPKEGRQCLMLQITPRDAQHAPAALERTFLAVNSPAVRLEPGRPVKISCWVRIPKPIAASVDGALLYDSAGGEPLAVRLTDATEWKRFTLYRQVPASGFIQVTLALTGLGTAYFDDVRIEPLAGPAVPKR